jgi:Protein phosphatase 2C
MISYYNISHIAGTGKMTAKDLSRDHKPDDADEMARIKQWGGFVSPAPDPGLSARVYLDAEFTMIGLAMSRSIGGCFILSYLILFQLLAAGL